LLKIKFTDTISNLLSWEEIIRTLLTKNYLTRNGQGHRAVYKVELYGETKPSLKDKFSSFLSMPTLKTIFKDKADCLI
jgi:hypothetical protein